MSEYKSKNKVIIVGGTHRQRRDVVKNNNLSIHEVSLISESYQLKGLRDLIYYIAGDLSKELYQELQIGNHISIYDALKEQTNDK